MRGIMWFIGNMLMTLAVMTFWVFILHAEVDSGQRAGVLLIGLFSIGFCFWDISHDIPR